MKNKALIIGLVVIVVLLAGGAAALVFMGDKSNNKSTPANTTSSSDQMANMDQKTSSSNTDTSQPAQANTVEIKDFAYGPASTTVKVGTKVTWTNQDSVEHTITADNGDGPQSELFGKGQSFSYTFTKAGTYAYHCKPHPYMKGTVTVTE